ncbi:MAG TPA: hypothetical protein VI300_10670, partial [Solirubrobacter sp.]
RRLSRIAAAARGLFGAGDGLHRCPDCGRPFMCPIEWETAGEDHWLIASRCGECGAWHSELATNEEASRFDIVLARQSATIVQALARLERERMEVELDMLVGALDRDLIDAGDFAR